MLKDLKKSNEDKVIGGVCGGLGEHTPIPSWLWRVFFISTVLVWGVGILPYLILWLVMPKAE